VLSLAALVAVVLLGAKYLGGGSSSPPPAAPPVRVERARPAPALVHVAGAVRRPGVYRMKPGARIDDAVRQAGGPTSRADLSAVNLAAKVEDGRQVLVPERARRGAVASGADAAAAVAAPGQPLNLNTATLEQLDTLAGVGPATAQKILDFREEHGGFGSVDELAQVPGIGEKRLASLKEQVRV
jgi:competence protein ComEA